MIEKMRNKEKELKWKVFSCTKQNGNPNEKWSVVVHHFQISLYWEPRVYKTCEMFSNFVGSSRVAQGKSLDPIIWICEHFIAFYKHFNVIQRTMSDASTASNKKSKVCQTFSAILLSFYPFGIVTT